MATHDMVAHKWAHQSGRGNRATGHHMFYDGDTIYSYGGHFPIARIIDAGADDACVLFTVWDYSISTSKHKTITRRACSHIRTYDVPFLRARTPEEHEANAESFAATVALSIERSGRRRKPEYAEFDMQRAEKAIRDHNDYCARFGVERKPLDMGADRAELFADIRRRAAEARERERERKRVRRAEYTEKLADRRAEYAEKLAEWQAGGNVRPLPMVGASYHLRINGDTMETTGGARFPVDDARRAWPILCRMRDRLANGETIKPDLCVPFGHFSLSGVTAKGVRAGCHFIEWQEVERIARELGL